MSKRKNLHSITAVYTSEEEKAKIIAIADKNGITQSEVMRLLLATYTPSEDVQIQNIKLI